MTFRASFCNPFDPKIKEIGTIDADKVIPLFDSIDWIGFIDKMENAFGAEIHYSPSLEVENIENKNGLSLSIVTKTEWYVFFKRPKTVKVKKFFGLKNIDKFDENYVTHLTGQNKNFARECIQALLTNDLSFLEENIR